MIGFLSCDCTQQRKVVMSKEYKHRKDEKKKPQMSLKERRAKKHEKKAHRNVHIIDQVVDIE